MNPNSEIGSDAAWRHPRARTGALREQQVRQIFEQFLPPAPGGASAARWYVFSVLPASRWQRRILRLSLGKSVGESINTRG
ncbi:MAG: hypothetical protein ABI651_15595, partial [Verrucomicrobiota bacterium]